MIAVTYVGTRPSYRDGCYGSGIEFEKGQTLLVPDDIARRLLKHPDVYQPGKDDKAQVAISKPELIKESEADTQDIRDSLMTMDSDALAAFVMTNYRIKLDKRMSIENQRNLAIQNVDLYGVT